ncbi:HisA/HisF-related TIM barrel protein, partial [Neisseria sicca]|uniref:HisA/HisF-related TIM barrel protein n=1 Tax=Neisseria sicca TaxID=490 RepID=UPI0021BE6D19
DLGLKEVIMGRGGVKNGGLVGEGWKRFGGEIMVGLDGKEGMVGIEGWGTVREDDVIDSGKGFEEEGVKSII